MIGVVTALLRAIASILSDAVAIYRKSRIQSNADLAAAEKARNRAAVFGPDRVPGHGPAPAKDAGQHRPPAGSP